MSETRDAENGAETAVHVCSPPALDGSPESLRMRQWACPECGIRYILVKRMIGRRMRGEWRRMPGQPTEVEQLRNELTRYREIEAGLRARCAGLERARVGGGVLGSDVPTAELRQAFGWDVLPTPLPESPHLGREDGP